MENIKHFINVVSAPQIMFTFVILIFFFVFPPTENLYNLNRKLRINKLWTKQGGIALFAVLILFFAFGLTDENFRKIVTKADNVPIVGLIFLVVYFYG